MTAPGTIGVLAGQLGRYTAFHQCLAALDTPPGTVVQYESSSHEIWCARNRLITR